MTDHLLRVARGLVSILRVIAGILLVASVLLNFANVVGRYFFFGASIFWAEEIMLYLMAAACSSATVSWPGQAGSSAWM